MEKRAVSLFSGGLGSWAATYRYRAHNPSTPLVLLFTDTGMEDDDLHRFLHEAATTIDNAKLVILGGDEGDLWDLFDEQNFIANTRADLCSRIRKRERSREWIEEQYPDGCDIVVGIDWTEAQRYDNMVPHWEPTYTVVAPLLDSPLLDRDDHIRRLRAMGIEPPRLYALGFEHNNCGGFCVKQGHKGFAHLLRELPDRYAYHEKRERQFRERTGKNVAVLRDRRGGTTKPMTLEALRIRVENGYLPPDDQVGCDSCMIPR